MRLKDKGPVIAPPVLSGWAQTVSLEIESWPGIISATHWMLGNATQVDGADFYHRDFELGHIHLDGEIHLVLTAELRKAVIDSGLAQRFRWGASWVQFPIENETSAQHGLWLFRLAYDRAQGANIPELIHRIELATQAQKQAATNLLTEAQPV